MHDFVSYLFYLLQRGMRFAVPTALVCGLILAVCYAVCRRQGRRFPWGKAVCALLSFALCLALLFFVRNESDEPILHVALKPAGEQDAAYAYETVYASGKSRACDAFTPDTCVLHRRLRRL